MDLFGLKEHEHQHQELERHVRRLVEQVAELTIDLGQTRVELRRLGLDVEEKVSTEDVDPALIALNDGIKRAREQLAETESAAEDAWDDLSEELSTAIQQLREQFE